MAQQQEADRFAARLRALKERSGLSFEALSSQSAVGSSTIHRYCTGSKIPSSYGIAHTIAKVCGASGEELRELHRLWVLADSSRSSQGGPPATDNEGEETADSAADKADENAEEADRSPIREIPSANPLRRWNRRAVLPVMVSALTGAVIGALGLAMVENYFGATASGASRPETAPAVSVHVFNVVPSCQGRTDHVPACSMGLAGNPRAAYDAGNVVAHRVWHGDVLVTDCVLYDGAQVGDETGVATTRWFRVRLEDVPGGHAWLPAVRTHDSPALPTCRE